MNRPIPGTLVTHTMVGAVIGAITALVIGLIAVRLAPDNGFADLAAGAVTRVVLIPVGAAVGAVVGYRSNR